MGVGVVQVGARGAIQPLPALAFHRLQTHAETLMGRFKALGEVMRFTV